MSQPPNHENDPQWDPQNPGSSSSQQPGPVGPDGQPYAGPVGPDGQPYQDHGAPVVAQGTKFGIKQLLSAIVVIALLGAGAFFLWQNYQKDAALAVGNCLAITGESDDADHELVDCEDETLFSYHVGQVIDGDGICVDEYAVAYSISETSGRGGSEKVTKVACLVPQLFEGTCYVEAEGVMDLQPADCSEALLKVTKVTDGTGSECAAEESQLAFTHPARTYCLAALDG